MIRVHEFEYGYEVRRYQYAYAAAAAAAVVLEVRKLALSANARLEAGLPSAVGCLDGVYGQSYSYALLRIRTRRKLRAQAALAIRTTSQQKISSTFHARREAAAELN